MWHGTDVPDRTGRKGRLGFLAGHSRRQTGARALVLFVVSSAAALALAARFHQDAVAVAVGILVGLPALYLAWAAFRGTEAAAPDLGRTADDLALAVGRQWEVEAGIRRLNDPYPLPVCWAGADAELADDWDALVTLARTGAGWPRSSPEGWAAGPADLAGCGDQIGSVLGKVPTRRLVVLGEPGTGKTMLMVRLVLDLLAGRAQGGPVPVLVPLASWDPDDQELHDWLAARLAVDYPALAPARSRSAHEPPVSRLLEAGLITLVLDGLDEMPEEMRGRALAAISDALRPGEPVVVTCRAADYRAAVLPPAGSGMTVRGAAVIGLQPLDVGTVADYLRQGGGPVVVGRWEQVIGGLGTGTPVGQALTTPLMAGLAQAIYNPRSGERAGQLPDPGELCHLADKEAVQAHLFDAFIPAAYRYRPDARWQAQEARSWLAFLARHLEDTVNGPDLAWWQLHLASRRASGLVVGLVSGFVAGLVVGLVSG